MQVNELGKTPLNSIHHRLGAKMMDFAGWEMPVWYTSILEEHRAVRTQAGIFDVSDMGRVWITGRGAGAFLDRLLTKPVQRLPVGGAQLCLMCFENGGILDDLWVYRVDTDRYLIVWNAANFEKKRRWMRRWSGEHPSFVINDVSAETIMVAVQGPTVHSLKHLDGVSNLPRFGHKETKVRDINSFIARTGYTGEDGFEIIAAAGDAESLWKLFTEQGVKPCGLGCRDSLRLEAGMMLCGQDMDSNTNPFEAGLGWLVEMEGSVGMDDDRFIGKEALLEIQRRGITRKLVGFQMVGREIARNGYEVFKSGEAVGVVTSGGYAPTLAKNIGLAYVSLPVSSIGTEIEILVHNKMAPAFIVNKRFYKNVERGGWNEPQKLHIYSRA